MLEVDKGEAEMSKKKMAMALLLGCGAATVAAAFASAQANVSPSPGVISANSPGSDLGYWTGSRMRSARPATVDVAGRLRLSVAKARGLSVAKARARRRGTDGPSASPPVVSTSSKQSTADVAAYWTPERMASAKPRGPIAKPGAPTAAPAPPASGSTGSGSLP